MPALYREIADDICARMLDGDFATRTALPSENSLAATYGVARGTIRRALTVLRDRGELTSRQGASWFVTGARHAQDFQQLRSFAQWARSRGMTPGGHVVSARLASATVTERRRLRLDEGDDVLHVVRVRTLDERRVMLERTTYATWIAPAILSLPSDEESVVQTLIKRFGVEPTRAENTVDAVAASSDDARLLGIRRSSPLLRLRRGSYDAGGRPIEYGEDRYVPGTVAFHVRAVR